MVIVVENSPSPEVDRVAKKFGFSIEPNIPQGDYLFFEQGKWVAKGKSFSIEVCFDQSFKRLAHQKLTAKKDLLARAVGLDKTPEAQILDVTLGLGKDAFHLAYLGGHVTAVERDPVPYILVESALEDSIFKKVRGSMKCHFGPSEEFLSKTEQSFDALYLDPMFEDTDKKSLPKKEMQFLRRRQVETNDYTEIIELALRKGIERVVVKRPLKGSKLYPEPQTTLSGKIIRYDIYRKRP